MKVEELMTRNPITVSYNSTVSDAVNLIRKHRIHEVIVFKNGEFFGTISCRQLIERSVRLNEKVSSIAVRPITLKKDDNIDVAIEKLLFCGYRDIPVVGKNRLAGVLSEIDVIKTVKAEKRVKDVMSPIKFLSNQESPVSAVRNMLIKHSINRIPVVDENGGLAGIISTINLLDAVITETKSRVGERAGEKIKLKNIPAKSLMERNVFTVKENDNLPVVINIMTKNRVSSVVVVKNNKPVGIITPKTILNLIYQPDVPARNVEITGMGGKETRYLLTDFMQRKLRKIEKMAKVASAHIDVKEHKKSGGKTKYELKAGIMTPDKTFFASCADWNIFRCADKLMERIGREIARTAGKKKTKLLEKT